MKLTAIHASNFLGAPRKSIPLKAAVCVIAGPNGAGKSSLIEGVRFALRGDPPRSITKKGDYDQLLTHGAKAGTVGVTFAGDADGPVQMVRKIVDGKLIAGDEFDEDMRERLGFVLDAHTFNRLDARAQRAFVFKLLKIKADWGTIRAELEAEGLTDGATLEQIGVYIRSGWPEALENAKTEASEARGAWKAVTGEAYGEVKAETWVAPGSDAEPDAGARDAEQRYAAAKRAVQQAQLEHANLTTKAEAYTKAAEALKGAPSPDECAATLAKAAEKVAEAELAVKALEGKAEAHGGTTAPCPSCKALITYDRGHFHLASEGGGVPSAAELAELATARAVLNGLKIAQGDAQRASARYEALRSATPVEVTKKQLTAAKKAVDDALLELEHADNAARSAGADAAAIEAAKAKTTAAREHHERCKLWLKAIDLLRPEGVQTTLLLRGLKPLNTMLYELGKSLGWDHPQLGADFVVRVGGMTAYPMLSESEQWRADLLFAAAISQITGLRLLLLDRFDVLDNEGRNDLLHWLCTDGKELFDTVIAAGTLKSAPTALATTYGAQVVWIDPTLQGEAA